MRLLLRPQTRLKPHFMGTRPDDGSNTKLYLEVEKVVPRVFEKQILKEEEKKQQQ